MPLPLIKSFAKKSGKSEQEVEKLWKDLKDQYGDDYQRIVGTLKKMLNINESSSFREYIGMLDYNLFKSNFNDISESVINKISKLYLITDPDAIVKRFKEIFNIEDEIKITHVDTHGSFNPNTLEIKYTTLDVLLHELIHYLQKDRYNYIKYIEPSMTDEGILNYILQPNELNGWAITISTWALKYNTFEELLDTQEVPKVKNKESFKKYILFLLQNPPKGIKQKYINKLLKFSKEYFLVVKRMQNIDFNENRINIINDIL